MSDPQKAFSFRGASPPGPLTMALPLVPAGGSAPDSRYRLALRAGHGQGPSTFFIQAYAYVQGYWIKEPQMSTRCVKGSQPLLTCPGVKVEI